MDEFSKHLCELHRQSIQAAKETKRKGLLPGYFKAAMKDVRYGIDKEKKMKMMKKKNKGSNETSNRHNSPGVFVDTEITTADQRSER